MSPYYASDIDEMVNTVDEDRIYRAMMTRTREQLEKYAMELDMRGMSDDKLRSSRLYQFAQKCVDVRRKQWEIYTSEDELLTKVTDMSNLHVVEPARSRGYFWNPLTSIIGFITAVHLGAVVGRTMADWTGAGIDHDKLKNYMGE